MAENTLSRPGEFDALEKARPDELIFSLLERDLDAPATIIFWCGLRRKRAFDRYGIDSKMIDELKEELRQIAEAELIAVEMRARQRGEEAAETMTKTYSGNVDPDAELNRKLAKLRADVGEADYHAHKAIEIGREINSLKPGRIDETTLLHLASCAETLHAIALELSPHRRALLAESELPLIEGEA